MKTFGIFFIKSFLLRFRSESLEFLILVFFMELDSRDQSDPHFVISRMAFNQTKVPSIQTLVNSDPLMTIEMNPIAISCPLSILIDSCHFSQLNELKFVAKDRTQSFDCFSYMNLFESFNIDIALDIFVGGSRQNGKRVAFTSKIDTLVDKTHANLSFKASLDSDLPQARVTDGRL